MTINDITSSTITNIEQYYDTRRDEIKELQKRYELDHDYIPIYNRKFVIDGELQSDLVNYPVHVDFFGNIAHLFSPSKFRLGHIRLMLSPVYRKTALKKPLKPDYHPVHMAEPCLWQRPASKGCRGLKGGQFFAMGLMFFTD